MGPTTPRKAYRVVVHGRVQGVYFRAYTADRGKALNLSGWVRNRHDGTVETFFQGNPEETASMLDWLSMGSPSSAVARLDVQECPPDRELFDFVIAASV